MILIFRAGWGVISKSLDHKGGRQDIGGLSHLLRQQIKASVS